MNRSCTSLACRRSPSRWRCGGRSSSSPSPCRRCTARHGRGPGWPRRRGSSATETGTDAQMSIVGGSRPAARAALVDPGDGPAARLRVEEDRQPAVGDLTGQVEILRTERGQVDRDLRPDRLQRQHQRLARPVRQRQGEMVAAGGHPAAFERLPDDLHVLPGAADRIAESNAVPALGDLRSGHAEPEPEPAAATARPGWRPSSPSSPGCGRGSAAPPNRCRSGGSGPRRRPARSPRPSRRPPRPRRCRSRATPRPAPRRDCRRVPPRSSRTRGSGRCASCLPRC